MSDNAVQIIAEAGVNHNGSLDIALDLVDAAAETGADIVKFQTFSAKSLVSASAPRAEYQKANTGDSGSQLDMLLKMELSKEDHQAIIDRCAENGIAFLSTPFDPGSLQFLAHELDLDLIKLGSSELTNAPLLVDAGRTGKRFILSTGMGTLAEVEQALGALAFGYDAGPDAMPGDGDFEQAWKQANESGALRDKISILQCTTAYPTPPKDANLRAMTVIADHFDLPVGFSDHTNGLAVSTAAVAMGATVIEKHLTLDRNMPGPDHKASLEPTDFRALVDAIRCVEDAFGDGDKKPRDSELPNIAIARKSLHAGQEIAAGDRFSTDNLIVMRPGDGRSPYDYWSLLGKTAKRAYRAGDPIDDEE